MKWWRERRRERREQEEQAARNAWLKGVLARARDGEGRTVEEILHAASVAMDREADERNRRGSVIREGPIFGWYGP